MGYSTGITSVGQQHLVKGYVTVLKSVLVGGSDPASVERKLGYTPGSLAAGYWLLTLAHHSQVFPKEACEIGVGDFEYRGYTHLEDGKPAGDEQNVHDALKARMSKTTFDQRRFETGLEAKARELNAGGLERLAKVYPIVSSQVGYKPGHGVPQYRLTIEKTFDVVARVEAGQSLSRTGEGTLNVV